MKKFIIGFVLASVMGVGVTAMADTVIGKGADNRSVQVIDYSGENNKNSTGLPVNNLISNIEDDILSKEKLEEVEQYIIDKYGANWRVSLRKINGDDWDDILEKELEKVFAHKYDDLIDDIIDEDDDLDDYDDDSYKNNGQNYDTEEDDNDNDDGDYKDTDDDNEYEDRD